MKISIPIGFGIVAAVVIAIVVGLGSDQEQSNQDKIRIAFFPSIGHAAPIVGIENGIFQNGIGEGIEIETKIFDSGP